MLYTKQADSVGRDFSLTFIQVVCAIAVVTLHTNGCFWNFSATERYWFTANIIESVFYFGVPIFFMISGITLLDYQKRYSTKEYFRKRIEKTVIPYVAWSLIGVFFRLATKTLAYETLTAKWIVNGLLSTSGIINLYWFFQPLFCLYLCIPVFAAIEEKKKIAEYILIIALFINILPPFLNTTLSLGLQWPYSVSIASGYILWLWLGYYFYRFPPERNQKVILYLLAIFGLAMHIIGTYRLSIEAGKIIGNYKGYNNIPNVLYSLGVFLFYKNLGEKIEHIKWLKKLIKILGNYTFALYLLHWFILQILVPLFKINILSIYYRIFAPFPIFLIVIILTWVIRKIPVLRRIVP